MAEPGPGYLLYLEHYYTHHDNPRADCIGCFPPEDVPELVIGGAGYLNGMRHLLSGTATTNLARDPDDPFDPDEDQPWSVINSIEWCDD